jgi:gluconolactonase
MSTPADVREIATGLQFPEGPVVMPDGTVLVVEIRRGTLSRVGTDGSVEIVADLGGGPNGAAIGPDGACYVANNGGFLWSELDGMLIPFDLATMSNQPTDFSGGWIDRVDLHTGEHQVLYKECGGLGFRGPNDIVFDADGGFWFTDFGKSRAHDTDRGGLYYGTVDGKSVVQVARGLLGPNGVGLSPGGDRVYVAESYTGRLNAWDITAPGKVASPMATVVEATKGHFDSLAVEAGGAVIVAAIGEGLCVVQPDGGHEYVALPDRFTTNVCFGGGDLRTAYATLSGTGRLVALDWPRPGLPLAF